MWDDTTQAITSHQMTWPSHDLTPQQTSRHQNTSLQSTKHHHHGTAEGSFTAKKWFGHRAGRSPCAHSIGKFFLCYIVLFLLETSAPGLSGHYWYIYIYIIYIYIVWCFCNGPKLRKCTFAVVQIMEDYRLNMNKLLIWWNTFCIHKDCFKQKSAHSTLPPTTVGPGPGCGLCLQASEVSNSWCLCLVVGPVAVESVRNPSWRDTVRATRDGWKWVVLNLQ